MQKNGPIKEVKVLGIDRIKKIIYLVKQELLNTDRVNIVSGTSSVGTASGAAETLKRLGYIEYDNIQTETVIEDNRRHSRFVITVHKTANFDRLYKEQEEKINKLKEERQEKEKETAKEKEKENN